MTSVPELPLELQRLIRERAHRKTSLAEGEVLTGRAIATETRRTPVDGVRVSDVKGGRPTVEFAEEPDVDYRPPSYSSLYADEPATRQPPFDSIAEPSVHSRPGTGTGTITGHSYSPFRDAGPDEISWISRYRSYCHPPRPPRRPLSIGGNHYAVCSPSHIPPSCGISSLNPFSVVSCHLLPRSPRDANRSASGLSWKQADGSPLEALRRPCVGLSSSSINGALRTKSGHPLRKTYPPRSTTAKYHTAEPNATAGDPRCFNDQAAIHVATIDKLCSSITICSMVGEERPSATPRSRSQKRLNSVSGRGKRQQKAKRLGRDRRSVSLNTDKNNALQNEEVSAVAGMNGSLTDETVVPETPRADLLVNGTVSVNDETSLITNGTVSNNGEKDAITSGTILTPNGLVSVRPNSKRML